MKLNLYYPTKPYRVNQKFGLNPQLYAQFGLAGHNGEDLYATHGQPVYAAHDGICYLGKDGNEGLGVVLRSLEPVDFEDYKAYAKSVYWHLKGFSVSEGQKVKTGELIGWADNTGFSTGDHLHFGLKPQMEGESNGSWSNVKQDNGFAGAIDPFPYWTGFHAVDIDKVKQLEESIKIAQQQTQTLKTLILSFIRNIWFKKLGK